MSVKPVELEELRQLYNESRKTTEEQTKECASKIQNSFWEIFNLKSKEAAKGGYTSFSMNFPGVDIARYGPEIFALAVKYIIFMKYENNLSVSFKNIETAAFQWVQ